MDHLLPPLGVGSSRDREALQAWGTGCSASPFQCFYRGSTVTFYLLPAEMCFWSWLFLTGKAFPRQKGTPRNRGKDCPTFPRCCRSIYKNDSWEYKDALIYVSTHVATNQFVVCGSNQSNISYPGSTAFLAASEGGREEFIRCRFGGCHSGEWPPMSLCGFDKDLSSFSVYRSAPLWRCLLRPAATSVSTSREESGYYRRLPFLSPHLAHTIIPIMPAEGQTAIDPLTKHLAWRGKDATAAEPPCPEQYVFLVYQIKHRCWYQSCIHCSVGNLTPYMSPSVHEGRP